MSRRGSKLALVPFFVGLSTLACQGPPPDQVRVELPELALSGDAVHATVYARRNGASAVTHEKTAFTVTPPDVAAVSKTGDVTCARSGDATLTANIQGKTGNAPFKCRLVDHIDLGTVPLFDLTKPPVVLAPHAVSKSGAQFDDVPVVLSADSSRIVSVTGNTLTPVTVGNTTVTARAGSQTKQIPVRVVRTVTAEALPLEGGHRIYFGLPEGKYEIEIQLLVDKTLSVEWRGAPYCAYKGYGRTHTSSCVLQGKGGAVVDNPAFLLNGATTLLTSGISIREVP